jgi:hypothetical protein
LSIRLPLIIEGDRNFTLDFEWLDFGGFSSPLPLHEFA